MVYVVSMNDSTEPRHPIRVVAQRTGLTPATLRAWERRYGVVDPGRSDGGQRLYSDADVDRLLRLRLLTDAGRSISRVAELSDDDARALLREDRAAGSSPPPLVPARKNGADPEQMVEDAFARVEEMESEALEAALRRGAVVLGAIPFLEMVVAPLLRRVGEAWEAGEMGPAEEHLATGVVERVLQWLTQPVAGDAQAPRMLVATLPGERHGLGAMLVSTAAALLGWRVSSLGTDLPPEDVAIAARTLGVRVVAVSVVNSAAASRQAVRVLRRELPPAVHLLVGGGAAHLLELDDMADAQVVQDLPRLQEVLTGLA